MESLGSADKASCVSAEFHRLFQHAWSDCVRMSVLAWSPEKRLLVMFHKILRWERRAGQSTAIVNLSPASVVTLPLQPGETLIGEVTNRPGRRFRFGNQAVYIESVHQWVRVPYDSILAYHCMAERTNIPQDESLKRVYYRVVKEKLWRSHHPG